MHLQDVFLVQSQRQRDVCMTTFMGFTFSNSFLQFLNPEVIKAGSDFTANGVGLSW